MTALPLFIGIPITPGSAEIVAVSPSEISLWEAHAKGYASIVSSGNSLSYIIASTASVNITVDEYAMIMSPNPYQSGSENPGGDKWAQDGALTYGTIAPGSSLAYNYGDYVVGAFSPPFPPPPWWCTEDSEYTAPNVPISLTGEILPFDLWDDVRNPSGVIVTYDRGDIVTYAGETQAAIWTYLRNNAAPVIGKTPMWELIPNLPTEVDIKLAVTNIGFVAAPDVIVEDTLPEDFSYKAGSFNIDPSSIVTKPDGSTVLQWSLGSLRGAIQTGDTEPTDYAHIYISYTINTPELPPDIRYFLPRAEVDKNDDNIMDAHSEEPLLETYFVNRPPIAIANNPTIDEGQTAILDGTGSYDPDEIYGDQIASYEWDLDNDGTTDVTGPLASIAYGDNGIYPVTLTVTDSYGDKDTTIANITVLNVPPTADADGPYSGDEPTEFTFAGSMTDPGWLDTHTYEWDFSYDGITFYVDATDQTVIRTFSDDYDSTIALRVTDDDGGVGIDTTTLTVDNVDPTVTIETGFEEIDIGLRVAGSKWSNVAMTLYEDDEVIGYIEVERWPGSPDDNPCCGSPIISVLFNESKSYRAVVTYDPYPDIGDEINGDQPNNGKDKKDNAGNPIWIVLTPGEGNATKIHHTFNTQQSMIRDSDHWNHVEPWEVELTGYLAELAISLKGTAYDPGADDLTFMWEFDDGTIITNYYPNTAGSYPVNILDTMNYAGSASQVTLTVEDDDGGIGTASLLL